MRKQLSLLAGVAAAGLMATSAHAGIGLSASVTDGTVDGSYQTALISLTGAGAGTSLISVAGDPTQEMVITTGDASTFFNIDTIDIGVELFNGQSPFAAAAGLSTFDANAPFDSGFMEFAGDDSNPSPGFNGEIGFAAFGDGAGGTSQNIAIFDLDQGTPVDASGPVDIIRLTFDRNTSATFTAIFKINTPLAGEVNEVLSITIPAVPAPGAMALLGLAGICGVSRRRRKA